MLWRQGCIDCRCLIVSTVLVWWSSRCCRGCFARQHCTAVRASKSHRFNKVIWRLEAFRWNFKVLSSMFYVSKKNKTERGRLSTHPTPVRTISGKDNIRGRMRSFLHVKCVFLFTVVHHQKEITFFHPQSLKDSTVYNTHTMFKLIMFSKCDISLKLWTGRRTFHLKYTYIRYNVADWVYPGRW